MSICKGIGNGIGGAIGKWGAGLSSVLGLGAAVDFGVRTYTGYGLFEILSVPYIECADGTFSSAIEWYGSGFKCPKKSPSVPLTPAPPSPTAAALGYAAMIEALGGSVFPYLGGHAVARTGEGVGQGLDSGHFNAQPVQSDRTGNTVATGLIQNGNGQGDVQGFGSAGDLNFGNYGWGGWSSMVAPAGFSFHSIRENPETARTFAAKLSAGMSIIGVRVSLPGLPESPPVANIPPPSGFSPNRTQNQQDCEKMSCPCLTPADIEMAVKRAIGVTPFAPEKLIREMGARIFAAPGPSLVPITPTNLVDAIAALVATNYMRAGYGRYPVVMPDSIVADDNPTDVIPTLPIENYAEWFEWYLKQFDAILGQFPIKIAIVDGAKRQPLKFENVSEALAEMTGLLVQTSADADAAVAVGSHAAVAATKAQCAAIVAQKNAECLIRFFGVRTAFSSIFVQSAITPQDSDNPNFNLKKFLTPSQESIVFLTDDDPFDFQAVMDRILRNSEIAKSAVALDAKSGLVGDYAKNQRKYDTAEARREAEKELEKLQATINAKNPEFKVKIRVDTPSTDEIPGNNFVIKRPKTAPTTIPTPPLTNE